MWDRQQLLASCLVKHVVGASRASVGGFRVNCDLPCVDKSPQADRIRDG